MISGAITLGAHPLTVAAGRLAFAALLLTPIAWARSGAELRRTARRDWLWALLSGVFLAIHFATWISSLAYTSVASSTALVATNPLFVAIGSFFVFRERLGRGVWLGILLTIGGAVVIGFSDSTGGSGSNPLLGDVLALLGALCGSGYLLVGRALRTRVSLLPYIWMVYSAAAVVLLVWMALAGYSLVGLSPTVYLLLVGLAVGPQLLGHTSFNWALKYLSATFITVAILGEPVGSAILAALLLRQPVAPLQLAGGAILLAGIALATLAEHRAKAQQNVAADLQLEAGGS